MKLRSPDIVDVNNCRELNLIIRGSYRNAFGPRLRVVRVYEVHKARGDDTSNQSVLLFQGKLVPAHMRHAQAFGEPVHPSGNQVETSMMTELHALAEKEMHPETNPEYWSSVFDSLDKRFNQVELAKVRHCIAKRSNSRQDQFPSR